MDAVERFSFSQDISDLSVTCPCEARWRAYMESENLLGSPADLESGFENELTLRMV